MLNYTSVILLFLGRGQSREQQEKKKRLFICSKIWYYYWSIILPIFSGTPTTLSTFTYTLWWVRSFARTCGTWKEMRKPQTATQPQPIKTIPVWNPDEDEWHNWSCDILGFSWYPLQVAKADFMTYFFVFSSGFRCQVTYENLNWILVWYAVAAFVTVKKYCEFVTNRTFERTTLCQWYDEHALYSISHKWKKVNWDV